LEWTRDAEASALQSMRAEQTMRVLEGHGLLSPSRGSPSVSGAGADADAGAGGQGGDASADGAPSSAGEGDGEGDDALVGQIDLRRRTTAAQTQAK